MPSLKPDCACALQRKAGTVTAFAAEQCVLCSPVCPGTIAKYGQFSRISEVEEPAFSAVQTAWRRERDSNPRYGFPYSGFQDVPFSPPSLVAKHLQSEPMPPSRAQRLSFGNYCAPLCDPNSCANPPANPPTALFAYPMSRAFQAIV